MCVRACVRVSGLLIFPLTTAHVYGYVCSFRPHLIPLHLDTTSEQYSQFMRYVITPTLTITHYFSSSLCYSVVLRDQLTVVISQWLFLSELHVAFFLLLFSCVVCWFLVCVCVCVCLVVGAYLLTLVGVWTAVFVCSSVCLFVFPLTIFSGVYNYMFRCCTLVFHYTY